MSDLQNAIQRYDELLDVWPIGDLGPAVAAARLVASGGVVAKTDLREIRWCETHACSMPLTTSKRCWLSKIDEHLPNSEGRKDTEGPCRIVSAGLYLEGETE